MAVNSSSSSLSYIYHCLDSTVAVSISMASIITSTCLLLPLSLLIFYLGLKRWRKQRSFASTSNSDVFTYNSAAMELLYSLGFILYNCGEYFGLSELTKLGFYTTAVFLPGEMSFHVLTCVERYLAVVHPVIYLRLRQSGGVRIRNISIGCAWLLYCGWIGVTALSFPDIPFMPLLYFSVLSLLVMSYCSLSVLCVLIRPGPGELGGNRERVDPSKRRAFHTITAITAVVWLYLLGLLVSLALDRSQLLSYNESCIVLSSGSWFTLPNSLVLPLLFLHKERKLLCSSCNNN